MSAADAARQLALPTACSGGQHISVTSIKRRICLRGDLDLKTAPDLDAMVELASPSPGQTVVLDLEGLAFCDCAGVRAIDAQRVRFLGVDAAMVIVNPPPFFRRLLGMTGFDRTLDARPTS